MTTTLLITGGATGLGKSIALMWASQQKSAVNICIADINKERGDATVTEIKNLGADACYVHCDITKQDDIAHLRAAIHQQWQSIDIVINNAGVASGGSLQGESIEQWQ